MARQSLADAREGMVFGKLSLVEYSVAFDTSSFHLIGPLPFAVVKDHIALSFLGPNGVLHNMHTHKPYVGRYGATYFDTRDITRKRSDRGEM